MKAKKHPFFGDDVDRRLRKAARVYLEHVVKEYVSIEGKIELYSEKELGHSASIVAGVHRAMEHLLKLSLYSCDPIYLFPIPKSFEKFVELRQLLAKSTFKAGFPRSGTIGFLEAIRRVVLLFGDDNFDERTFVDIHTLRNSIEHCWDHNLAFLNKNISIMSSKILPSLDGFVVNILGEDPMGYLSLRLREDIERVDRARQDGHTFLCQKRLEEHRAAYKISPAHARDICDAPLRLLRLDSVEVGAECPVCGRYLKAHWDWEADFDIDGPVGAYPDPKLLVCDECGFYIEGVDINSYLEEDFQEYFAEEDAVADWECYE